jgi:drug/metabolite transporter (DMT)-like permease
MGQEVRPESTSCQNGPFNAFECRFDRLDFLCRDRHHAASLYGWVVLVALDFAVTGGILGVFASTARIGPFRTALFMNLEPTLGSAILLGEGITPLQAVGGAVMIAALMVFQTKR